MTMETPHVREFPSHAGRRLRGCLWTMLERDRPNLTVPWFVVKSIGFCGYGHCRDRFGDGAYWLMIFSRNWQMCLLCCIWLIDWLIDWLIAWGFFKVWSLMWPSLPVMFFFSRWIWLWVSQPLNQDSDGGGLRNRNQQLTDGLSMFMTISQEQVNRKICLKFLGFRISFKWNHQYSTRTLTIQGPQGPRVVQNFFCEIPDFSWVKSLMGESLDSGRSSRGR